MALVTGTPDGLVITQDEIYVDAAPPVFFQEIGPSVGLLHNPGPDGFYHGLSGTTNYPVFQMGCIEGYSIASNIEINDIRCDTVGNKGTIQKMSHLDLTFTLKTLFPLTTVRHIMRGGPVTTTDGVEKMGIGQPNNQRYFYVYAPTVYDNETGDFFSITGFRCQFVEQWTLAQTYGQQASMDVTIRMFADETKPADQLYASIFRADPSAVS